MNKVEDKPAKPCKSTETLNFEESTEGHRGGVRMHPRAFIVSLCNGAILIGSEISKSGGKAAAALPPRTRAVCLRLTRRIGSSGGSKATTYDIKTQLNVT